MSFATAVELINANHGEHIVSPAILSGMIRATWFVVVGLFAGLASELVALLRLHVQEATKRDVGTALPNLHAGFNHLEARQRRHIEAFNLRLQNFDELADAPDERRMASALPRLAEERKAMLGDTTHVSRIRPNELLAIREAQRDNS
ncbi:hypothetical protein H0Z60_12255 [Ectothiorhodospiraceae bacterium WFHF3C12]|nr:hypothetical protein [Ectothiorhodospiraceae bacterium WFHF3C12]